MTSESSKTIIYDFGSYDGNDIPYYLLKADLVVAVEANPALAHRILSSFTEEVEKGRLVVINKALSLHGTDALKFYIHKRYLTNSTVITPAPWQLDDYEEIDVSAVTPSSIVKMYGSPSYIKIDIEGIDHLILRDLFANLIYPEYISAESHHINTFCEMVCAGYDQFKLLDGKTIGDVFARAVIRTKEESEVEYCFTQHMAGPYGSDLPGDWLKGNDFFQLLAQNGLGWKDIHAKLNKAS